jgi:hypothetical protein
MSGTSGELESFFFTGSQLDCLPAHNLSVYELILLSCIGGRLHRQALPK